MEHYEKYIPKLTNHTTKQCILTNSLFPHSANSAPQTKTSPTSFRLSNYANLRFIARPPSWLNYTTSIHLAMRSIECRHQPLQPRFNPCRFSLIAIHTTEQPYRFNSFGIDVPNDSSCGKRYFLNRRLGIRRNIGCGVKEVRHGRKYDRQDQIRRKGCSLNGCLPESATGRRVIFEIDYTHDLQASR